MKENEKKLRALIEESEIRDKIDVSYYNKTRSTNENAKLAPRGALRDQLYLAETQTAGRGRLGRSFVSESGGLYMTLRFERRIPLAVATKATVYTAVCVRRALLRLAGVSAKIKWVNDIFIGERKLAGILCEAVADERGDAAVLVLGIGMNVGGSLSPEISDIATVLSEHTDRVPGIAELAVAITEEIYSAENESFKDIIAEYRAASLVMGRDIRVIKPQMEYTARAVDINEEGALVLRLPSGETETLMTGEVSIRLT